MYKLSDTVNRKFIESIKVSEWEIETETGFKPILSTNKTIEYEIYRITLDNNLYIDCADTHILIDQHHNEIFAKDSLGVILITKLGLSRVISVVNTGILENMYDLSIDSAEHTYYTNDILSHNTTTSAAYILWYTVFQASKTVAILANKATAAREVLDRYQTMYELLPQWMQQGVTTWNKGDVELENGSKIFTAATSTSGIRGKSCVTQDTKVCVLENDKVYYTEINKIINNSIFINVDKTIIKYTVYKTTNLINDMIYVGFHSIKETDILRREFGHLSCYSDGYLGSGVLLTHSVEKYGPENFAQEILGIFNTKEEGEAYERKLVNKDFVQEESNYNISMGGNVCILFGNDNGFYGKKHTKETLEKIQLARKDYVNNHGLITPIKIKNVSTNEIYNNYKEVLKVFNYDKEYIKYSQRLYIYKLCFENKIEILNKKNQNIAIDTWTKRLEFDNSIIIRHDKKAETASKRFKGIAKTETSNIKRSASMKEWIKSNPEQHKLKMENINKNPEKIKKTADKHRGMKRSEETRLNISKSLIGKPSKNKGRILAYNSATLDCRFFDNKNSIPENWTLGTINPYRPTGRKSYTNGVEFKMFIPDTEPQGWVLGAPKKNKK